MRKLWAITITAVVVIILAFIGIMYIVNDTDNYASNSAPIKPMKNVKVSLYYETMCPFSKDFIQDQICPVFDTLSEYFYVEFVPYGNALIEQDNTTEEVSISCQHDVEECEGNRIQSCALHHLSYSQSTQLICCMESQTHFDPQGESCIEQLGIDGQTIAKCGNGPEGERLHYLNGLKTRNLKPPPRGVPWIIFNDQFKDEEEIHDTVVDFKSALCKYIPAPKPKVCLVSNDDVNEMY